MVVLTSAEETRRLQVTIDHVPGMLGYWDRDGHNVTANDAYFEYFGLTPAQVRGRHLRDVLGDTLYALNLPFIDGVFAGEAQFFERTLVDRHGIPRYVQVSYVPDIVDAEVRGFVGQTVDVTVRVAAQHARDEALRLFHIGMASNPLGPTGADASEQSDLDATLHRIINAGMALTEARYGAIGIRGPDGTLTSFLHAGMDADTVQSIGELPSGTGLLDVPISEGQVLNIDEMAAHQAAAGFPAHHPPMRALLAVSITIRGVVFGNLYLTNPQTKPTFTQSDENAARTLASAAAVAVDHAQLFQRERSAAEFMTASRQITTELLSDPDPAVRPLQLIVDRACQLTGAEQAIVLIPADTELSDEHGQTLVVTAAAGLHAAEVLGQRVPVEHSTTGAVFRSGKAVINESLQHPIQAYSEVGDRPGIVMPLRANQIVIGVIAVARPKGGEPFDESYLELLGNFADHAALALTLAAAQESERQLIIAADRDRIAQDLHDHVIQQLIAAGMNVQGTIARSDSPVVTDRLSHTVDDLQGVVDDIRATIYRLQRPVERSGDFGQRIQHIVAGLTADSAIKTTLKMSGPFVAISAALSGHAEAVTREAVSNAVRHSGATSLDVEVTLSDRLVVDVVDNGCGIPADNQRRSGLANLHRRADLVGGQCQIITPPGGGTHVRWSTPDGSWIDSPGRTDSNRALSSSMIWSLPA